MVQDLSDHCNVTSECLWWHVTDTSACTFKVWEMVIPWLFALPARMCVTFCWNTRFSDNFVLSAYKNHTLLTDLFENYPWGIETWILYRALHIRYEMKELGQRGFEIKTLLCTLLEHCLKHSAALNILRFPWFWGWLLYIECLKIKFCEPHMLPMLVLATVILVAKKHTSSNLTFAGWK